MYCCCNSLRITRRLLCFMNAKTNALFVLLPHRKVQMSKQVGKRAISITLLLLPLLLLFLLFYITDSICDEDDFILRVCITFLCKGTCSSMHELRNSIVKSRSKQVRDLSGFFICDYCKDELVYINKHTWPASLCITFLIALSVSICIGAIHCRPVQNICAIWYIEVRYKTLQYALAK